MKITNTKDACLDQQLKMLVYGESGSGKTTLAGTINEPTIIVSAEGGLLSIRDKNIDVIDLTKDDDGKLLPKEKRFDRISEVYKFLLTEEAQKKYKWIFIDSLSEISQNLMEKLNIEFTERKDSLVMYGENAKRMRALIKAFRDLPNYNVIFTALSDFDKDENGARYTTIQMVGKIASQLPAYFDEVFYLYPQKQEDGTIKRILITGKTDKVVAKDRSGSLDLIESADLSSIVKKIRKNEKQTNKKEEKNNVKS